MLQSHLQHYRNLSSKSFYTTSSTVIIETMQRVSKLLTKTNLLILTVTRKMCEKSLWFVEIRRLKKVYQLASYLSQLTRFIAGSNWLLACHTKSSHTQQHIITTASNVLHHSTLFY